MYNYIHGEVVGLHCEKSTALLFEIEGDICLGRAAGEGLSARQGDNDHLFVLLL